MGRQPNRTKQALLGFLTWGPMSGYDLQKVVSGSISNFWSESYGRIYPILGQLADEGLATMERQPSSGGRPRNVYSISDAGREEFQHWLREPVMPRPLRNELLLKLFFGARTERANSVRMIRESQQRDRETLAHYEALYQELDSRKGDIADREYWLMTLRYGLLEVQARLAWSEETLAKLPQQEDEEQPA